MPAQDHLMGTGGIMPCTRLQGITGQYVGTFPDPGTNPCPGSTWLRVHWNTEAPTFAQPVSSAVFSHHPDALGFGIARSVPQAEKIAFPGITARVAVAIIRATIPGCGVSFRRALKNAPLGTPLFEWLFFSQRAFFSKAKHRSTAIAGAITRYDNAAMGRE